MGLPGRKSVSSERGRVHEGRTCVAHPSAAPDSAYELPHVSQNSIDLRDK